MSAGLEVAAGMDHGGVDDGLIGDGSQMLRVKPEESVVVVENMESVSSGSELVVSRRGSSEICEILGGRDEGARGIIVQRRPYLVHGCGARRRSRGRSPWEHLGISGQVYRCGARPGDEGCNHCR